MLASLLRAFMTCNILKCAFPTSPDRRSCSYPIRYHHINRLGTSYRDFKFSLPPTPGALPASPYRYTAVYIVRLAYQHGIHPPARATGITEGARTEVGDSGSGSPHPQPVSPPFPPTPPHSVRVEHDLGVLGASGLHHPAASCRPAHGPLQQGSQGACQPRTTNDSPSGSRTW